MISSDLLGWGNALGIAIDEGACSAAGRHMKPIHLDNSTSTFSWCSTGCMSSGSVTRAAASLNLTQSAISHALRRLRQSLRDLLFERHGTALVPTPLMKNLAQPLNDTLRSLEQVVNSGNHFEPSAAARRFVVGMDERFDIFALPSFVERLVKIAPNLDLASVHFDPREVAALLAKGEMDVALGAETFDNPSLKRLKVAEDHLIVAARAGHPLVTRQRISLRNYQAAEHMVLPVVRLASRPRTTCCSAGSAWRAASAFECVAT